MVTPVRQGLRFPCRLCFAFHRVNRGMTVGPEHREWLEGARLISIGLVAAVISAGLVISVGRAVLLDDSGQADARAEVLIPASTR